MHSPVSTPIFRDDLDDVEEYVLSGDIWLRTASCGEGPPLLFCHGGPGACDNLAPVASMIDGLARAHRYDQRGCGRSGHADSNLLADSVADIERLREHWGYERWGLCGHSWGASLALLYALAHPERVERLILLATTGILPIGPEYRAGWRSRLTPEELEHIDRLRCRMEHADEETLYALRQEVMMMKFRTDLADPGTALQLPEYDCPVNFGVNAALGSQWGELLGQEELRSRVAAIRAPVLILAGAADPRTDLGARDLAGLLPDARLVMLPGVGHYPWLEHPELLCAELRSALSA